MDDREKARTRQAAVLAGLMLAVPVGLLAWLELADRPAPRPRPATSANRNEDPQGAAPASAASVTPWPLAIRTTALAGAVEPAENALLINPADPDAPKPEGGPLHPHPITPQHERIFRENELIGDLFGAMDVKDGAGVRRLADRYRREYPEDPNQLQRGYDVIADCLEHPGPEATAAGQRYYDAERGSILRRFVARHCLGFEL